MGLGAGAAAGGQQVMVVGILLAVSAGMLALELAKVLAFATGGVAAWAAAQTVFPQAQELWAVFLSGGLVGVVLYRFWTMLMTSVLGVLLSWHATFILADSFGALDAGKFVAEHSAALNGGVIAVSIIGVLVQAKTSLQETPVEEVKEEDEKEHKPRKKKPHAHSHGEHEDEEVTYTWWQKMVPGKRAA
jgi:hypothetical protein